MIINLRKLIYFDLFLMSVYVLAIKWAEYQSSILEIKNYEGWIYKLDILWLISNFKEADQNLILSIVFFEKKKYFLNKI